MKKVTFTSTVKIGKKLKTFVNVEYTEASDDAIKLRALALNWTLVSIEYNKGA
jgi:hypothetical protein